MNNYKGLSYPVQKTALGFFHSNDDIAQIKASLLSIIMTKPGERVFEPYFGTPLHTLNPNKPLELLQEDCRQMIAKSLKEWEKRFPVTKIEVKVFGYDIYITVGFVDPVNLQQEHTLSVQVPLP